MQMVSVSDALSCLHGVSSSAPGKGIWQENIDAGCLISNGCDGEINCRLQDREMQILDVDSNSHHGAANSGIQPLKTAYYASTTEYGLLESCFKIGSVPYC